jgi:hypothetical protein
MKNIPLAVLYAYDDALRETANAEGRNYWYAYIKEILSRIGVSARPIPLASCADMRKLSRAAVLFLGDFGASALPEIASEVLERWVESGGVLIGFATEGLDSLFGVASREVLPQTPDPFSISGYFRLEASDLTRDCRAPVEPEQKLIILSPIRRLHSTGAAELARLFTCPRSFSAGGADARDSNSPAITWRKVGRGHAFYFAFNVAQTMWVLHQGRPVDRDYDGDGYLRFSDACVLAENSLRVPYADALHFLLSNMIGRRPVPMVHQIPPREGRLSPALFYFGGDDECEPGNQVPASDFMASRGLPYHMNLMILNGKFAVTPEERAHIEANGHELAIHYNFMDGFQHPSGFTREDVLAQHSLFRQEFGRDSVCGVNHWCRWCGWAEPARWMAEAGSLADNSAPNWTSPPLNPVNTIGFCFGSAFPRWFWDDAAHGNRRINLLELPWAAYEAGYEGESVCPEKIREGVELAVRYRLPFNFFWHPVYIAKFPACRQAIDEFVRLVGEMPAPPVLMGPDALYRWWNERSHCAIEKAVESEGKIAFEATCGYAGGYVVKAPVGGRPAQACAVDGEERGVENAYEFGQYWAFIALEAGRHSVELTL